MRFQSWEDNLLYVRVFLKPSGKDEGILTVNLHPSFKGLHSSKDEVRIECGRVSSDTLSSEEELFI